MSKLELYINSIKGGYHTLIAVTGTRREQVGPSTTDVDAMMQAALTMLEAGDYEPQLRVIDPGRIKCKTSDGAMTIQLRNLRTWVSPAAASVLEPDPSVFAVTHDNRHHLLGRHFAG